jgi:hypothetical protein
LGTSQIDNLERGIKDLQNIKMKSCCSFSLKNHTRELLWSHYADSWRGIRLHFKTLEKNKIYFVHYFNRDQQITEDKTHLSILRKLSSWSYESECRFISTEEGFSSFSEMGIKLLQIDMGIRVGNNLKKIVKRICVDHGINCVEDLNKISEIYQN